MRSNGRPATPPRRLHAARGHPYGLVAYPGAYCDANFNFQHLKRFAQTLERGRFDAFFMADLVRSNIKERGRWKVIDIISATLNDQDNVYEATFSNLGLSKVVIDS